MTLVAKFKRKMYFAASSYFRFWANFSLKRWRPRIIIITGSAGKTTMLNLVESQLGAKAHYSHNANSAFGIAFDILGMHGITGSKAHWLSLFISAPMRAFNFRHHEKFYVVECDGERPHEAEFIAKWLKPEVSLWVSLGRSHAVFYEDVVRRGKFKNVDEAIAHEFSTIPAHTSNLVLIDGDNAAMIENTKNIKAHVNAVSQSTLQKYRVYPDHTVFEFKETNFTLPEPIPRQVATQLAMLIQLMQYLEIPLKADLANFKHPPARSNYLDGKKGIKIIDSSYNAHIISMTAVLEMFKAMHAGHKWMVIGDIIDQGHLEGEEHRKLADLLADVNVERIVLVGRRTKKYTYPHLKQHADVVSFDKPQQALAYLEQELTGKETVLFKGSQYLEWIIEKLLANPADVDKLARQDAAHRRRRASWGLK